MKSEHAVAIRIKGRETGVAIARHGQRRMQIFGYWAVRGSPLLERRNSSDTTVWLPRSAASSGIRPDRISEPLATRAHRPKIVAFKHPLLSDNRRTVDDLALGYQPSIGQRRKRRRGTGSLRGVRTGR